MDRQPLTQSGRRLASWPDTDLGLTNALYALIENDFPEDIRYRIRGAITEDLGQRSLFLLLLTATVELTLYSLFKLLKWLVWKRWRA
jgi:hypothetical protein